MTCVKTLRGGSFALTEHPAERKFEGGIYWSV